MPHIYAWSYPRVGFAIAAALIVWAALPTLLPQKHWRRINVSVLIIAFCLILYYCVFYRASSNEHQFVFFSVYSNEFYRDMAMNAFLYFPLGLSLTVLIGPWSILAAFLLSLGIESWQFFAGTGLAQGTDVICNTIGCAVGAIPCLISGWLIRKKQGK